MFCACVSIFICFFVLIGGLTVGLLDVRRYDFGLYYALLAIVGLTAAIAVCVVRPKRGCCTRDPRWYTRCCENLNRCLIAEQQRFANAMNKDEGVSCSMQGGEDKRSGLSSNFLRQQRATLIMLRPAVELMQHMLNGIVTKEEHERTPGDEEDTSEITDELEDGSKNRTKSRKKRRKKKLLLPTNEACLYTILETSTATGDVSVIPPTEATSVVTVHETYPQLLNDSVPNSPAALLSPPQQSKPQLHQHKKHIFINQISSDSPRSRGSDVFTFQRHDILNEIVDEERTSEARASSTHE